MCVWGGGGEGCVRSCACVCVYMCARARVCECMSI